MPTPVYSPNIYSRGADTASQSQNAISSVNPFQPVSSGNPLVLDYQGYQGFGPSPYSFASGAYGVGSYGFQPGDADSGYYRPAPGKWYDTVGFGGGG